MYFFLLYPVHKTWDDRNQQLPCIKCIFTILTLIMILKYTFWKHRFGLLAFGEKEKKNYTLQ